MQINHPKLYKTYKQNPSNPQFQKLVQQGTGMVGIFKKGYTPIVLYKNEKEFSEDINVF